MVDEIIWIVFTIRVLVKNTLVGHGPLLPPSVDTYAQLVKNTSLIQKN